MGVLTSKIPSLTVGSDALRSSGIEDEDVALVLDFLDETVSDGGRDGLVGDTEHVEASDQAGIVGGRMLGVVDVGGDDDDGLGDDGSEVASNSRRSWSPHSTRPARSPFHC